MTLRDRDTLYVVNPGWETPETEVRVYVGEAASLTFRRSDRHVAVRRTFPTYVEARQWIDERTSGQVTP